MKTYHAWLRLFKLPRCYSWIVDSFHMSTRMHQLPTFFRDCELRWLEERLRSLGFHLVFCTRTPGSFAAARAERLKVSGNRSQYDDLLRFVDKQELMCRLVGESDNDVPNAADQIADWLAETDRLYAPT